MADNYVSVLNGYKLKDAEARKKFKDIVTPEMYGAVGDGVADDTEAIKSAFNACPAGGTLLFPANTYVLNEQLDINKKISIVGLCNTTFKSTSGTAHTYFYFMPGSAFSVMENITIECDGENLEGNTYAILAYMTNNITLRNIHVNNSRGIAVGLGNCYKCTLDNVHIDKTYEFQCGFWLGYDNDTIPHGYHTFKNCSAVNCSLDGVIAGEPYCTFDSCTFNYNGLERPEGGALGAGGIYCNDNEYRGFSIINCVCNGNGEYGINLESCKESIIMGCTCKNNALSGINGKFTQTNIIGNVCRDNGTSEEEETEHWRKNGITVFSPWSVNITGNVCTSDGVYQKYGLEVRLKEGHPGNLVTVVGNSFKYNTTHDYLIAEGVENAVVANNV